MTMQLNSYVNLKDFAEFNKFTTGLGAAAFVYFDKGGLNWCPRFFGILLSAVAVLLGVVLMSAKGRIKGDEIDYAAETDSTRRFIFVVMSRLLLLQLAVLAFAIALAGYASLTRT
jgi:hypothetical protein